MCNQLKAYLALLFAQRYDLCILFSCMEALVKLFTDDTYIDKHTILTIVGKQILWIKKKRILKEQKPEHLLIFRDI